MLNNRFKYMALLGIVVVPITACAGSTVTATVGITPTPEVMREEIEQEPDGEQPGYQDSPIATLESDTTLAPAVEEEDEEFEASESIGFYIRGYNYISRAEYVDAERTFTTVIELEPNFARGWDGRGQTLMLQGKYKEAMLDFDRAIELKPNLSDAYANRALTRLALNDYEGAARDAKRAIELDDQSVGAQLVLGRVYAKNGDSEKALKWFNEAIVTEPEDGATWWWRGRFYRDVVIAGGAALSDFNKAIELAPAQASIYIDRALLYMQADVDPDLARVDLEEAISLAQDPKLPKIIERAEELLAILDERQSR